MDRVMAGTIERLFANFLNTRLKCRRRFRATSIAIIERLEQRVQLSGTTTDDSILDSVVIDVNPPAIIEEASTTESTAQVFQPTAGHRSNSTNPAVTQSQTAQAVHIEGTCRVVIFTTEDKDNPDAWDNAAEKAKAEYEKLLASICDGVEVIIKDVEYVSEVNETLDQTDNVVIVVFIGHSGPNGIFIGADNEPGTNISDGGGPNDVDPTDIHWDQIVPIDGAKQIIILGCNAGQGEDCVAQDIADASGFNVVAADEYINFDTDGTAFIRWWRFGEWITFHPDGE
jgi:hypothetical protein